MYPLYASIQEEFVSDSVFLEIIADKQSLLQPSTGKERLLARTSIQLHNSQD